MELRELKASDMGAVCKIINAIGVKEFKDSFNVENIKNASAETVGLEVVFGMGGIIIENIPKAQKDIDTFLSSLTGQTVKEIQNMKFSDYGDLIIDVVTKEEFRDFFARVLKLFNR